jgi:Family of unknown function (DUF6152)
VKPARFLGSALGFSIALTASFGAAPALAHHSFGFFDMQKSTEISGTVEKYEWSNPHSWLFLAVPSPSGATVYGFEMSSVGELLRRGWAKNSVKPGDKIKVTYHPMRDGTPNGLLMSATTEDGTPIGNPVRPAGPPPT